MDILRRVVKSSEGSAVFPDLQARWSDTSGLWKLPEVWGAQGQAEGWGRRGGSSQSVSMCALSWSFSSVKAEQARPGCAPQPVSRVTGRDPSPRREPKPFAAGGEPGRPSPRTGAASL